MSTTSDARVTAAGVPDPLQRMVTGPSAGESVPQRGLRSDEWTGHCSRCRADTTLTVVKTDGRWTLRQLFGSSWTECDFDVACRRCGSRWPAQLEGEAMSVAGWLEQIRGGQDHGPSQS